MFHGGLKFESIPGQGWKTLGEVRYLGAKDEFFTIPAGFETDFASVPRYWWWLSSPAEYAQAALLHDFLWRENKAGRGPDPVDTDGLYRRALGEDGAGARRWPMWLAVRTVAILSGRRGRQSWPSAIGLLFVAMASGLVFGVAVIPLALILGLFKVAGRL